jgi:hypothetical protein
LPTSVFGQVEDASCVKDPKHDWSFFNDKEPGRHDAYVDIRQACLAYVDGTVALTKRLEAMIPCGPTSDGLVVCDSSSPPLGSANRFALFAMEARGRIPTMIPADATFRISAFIDGGGDPATKSEATPDAPNISAQGSNVLRQAIFGDPGTTEQPSIGLLAVDRRLANEFVTSSTRVWIRRKVAVFVIDISETGEIKGVRGAMFFGSRGDQGDEALGDEDVVPGDESPPWDFLMWKGKGPA